MAPMKSTMEKSIDDIQPSTVSEHFEQLMRDESIIDSKYVPVNRSNLPEWYNHELFKEGQLYYRRNMFSFSLATLSGLIAVVSIPSTLEVLLFTKQSSTCPNAYKRYVETYIHTFQIFMSNPLDSASNFYKSLNVIRWKHASSSKRAISHKISGITQRDMALTQWGFFGYVLLEPEKLALSNTLKEREAIVHFWRVIGYLIGIPDRLNICRKNEGETTELCNRIRKEVFAKYMKEESKDFILVARAILESFGSLDVSLNTDAFLSFTYELTSLEYTHSLSFTSNLFLKYYKTVTIAISLPFLGAVVRYWFNSIIPISLWIAVNFPILARFRYGDQFKPVVLYPELK